jgi:cobalt/nickel transport system permease protein
MLTSIGIGLSISLRPSGQLWQWSFGPLWLSTSPEALQQMLVILTRVIGSASALNFLALTTPMVDMVALLRRLRLPETLIDVMVIMYRFIFVLLDTLERMLTAQRSRLGYQTGYWRSMQNMGQVGARLFINAMQRSQRLETALLARGYNGTLPVLSLNYRPFPHFGWVMVILIGSLVGVRLVEPWLS